MPRSTTCEACLNDHWVAMDVAEALQRGSAAAIRCPECHGPVRAHKEGTTGQAAHFEHTQRHPGCSFSAWWDGKSRTSHPLAIA